MLCCVLFGVLRCVGAGCVLVYVVVWCDVSICIVSLRFVDVVLRLSLRCCWLCAVCCDVL